MWQLLHHPIFGTADGGKTRFCTTKCILKGKGMDFLYEIIETRRWGKGTANTLCKFNT
jgi:hypothetical protein